LRTGKIWGSKLLAGALILFVTKAYRKDLYFGIDYYRLNKIRVLNILKLEKYMIKDLNHEKAEGSKAVIIYAKQLSHLSKLWNYLRVYIHKSLPS
jgi:hypothetical protein